MLLVDCPTCCRMQFSTTQPPREWPDMKIGRLALKPGTLASDICLRMHQSTLMIGVMASLPD